MFDVSSYIFMFLLLLTGRLRFIYFRIFSVSNSGGISSASADCSKYFLFLLHPMNDCFFMFHSHPSSFSLIFFNALRYLERMVLGFFLKYQQSLHRYIHQKQTTPRSAFPHLLIPKILLLRQPASQNLFLLMFLRSDCSKYLRYHPLYETMSAFAFCNDSQGFASSMPHTFFFFPQLPPFFIGDQCRILYRIFLPLQHFSDNNMLFYTSGDKSLHNNG